MASQCLRCRSLLITRHGICLLCGWDESAEDSQDEKITEEKKEQKVHHKQ